jgi:hypothetical protein
MTSISAPFQIIASEDGVIRGGGYMIPKPAGDLRDFVVPAGLYMAPRPPSLVIDEEDGFTVEVGDAVDDELISRLLRGASERKPYTRRRGHERMGGKRKRRTRRRT